MAGENEQLEGGRELSYITQRDNYNGSLLARIIDAVNTLAKNAGVAAVGKLTPPPPINSITVSGGTVSNGVMTVPNSEILHWTMQHTSAIQKGIRYFSEIATEPNFLAPHPIEHGASRSGFLSLPTKDSSGNTQTYYLRSYAQYPGSDPCKPTVLGGLSGAIGIQLGGASKMDLLPSAGSGTASSSGQQGGKGLGVVLTRPAPRPKRSV
jgi:hypothetical protein